MRMLDQRLDLVDPGLAESSGMHEALDGPQHLVNVDFAVLCAAAVAECNYVFWSIQVTIHIGWLERRQVTAELGWLDILLLESSQIPEERAGTAGKTRVL